MIRKIIRIDKDACNGCGACATACHEGAIEMIDGKATLTREDYCDGLGDCLPACPTGAISFEMREAPAYDEAAVKAAKREAPVAKHTCPGAALRTVRPSNPIPCGCPGTEARALSSVGGSSVRGAAVPSRLAQWPCQIKLVPVNAPYFAGADLLIAADCTAYAYGNFHSDFIRGRITLIGCPKLDEGDYTEKLTRILAENDVKSVTVVRMEVPCCGGIEHEAKRALKASGKFIPWQVITISTDGKIIES